MSEFWGAFNSFANLVLYFLCGEKLYAYNQEKYIAASIESVLNQPFTVFQLLIFDDGPTDDSPKIIRTFDDERIKLFYIKKNCGSYFAVQDLLKIAKGKYVAFHQLRVLVKSAW